jgi:hypothetical protein
MINRFKLVILFLGVALVMFLFPAVFTDAARFESGVNVNKVPPATTEKVCDDTIDNDNDGKIDADDTDCTSNLGPSTVAACGLKIVEGAPVYYGQLNPATDSAEQKVTVKNEGTAAGKLLVKGEDWILQYGPPNRAPASGPEITHVAISPNIPWIKKAALNSDGVELGEISSQQSISIYFQLRVPYNGFSDLVEQILGVDIVC